MWQNCKAYILFQLFESNSLMLQLANDAVYWSNTLWLFNLGFTYLEFSNWQYNGPHSFNIRPRGGWSGFIAAVVHTWATQSLCCCSYCCESASWISFIVLTVYSILPWSSHILPQFCRLHSEIRWTKTLAGLIYICML